MSPQKFRWSKVYESSEEELVVFLDSRSITHDKQHVVAGEQNDFPAPEHELTLWCAEGSFSLATNGNTVSMQPGDAYRLPAGSPYNITAGLAGYICYISPAQTVS